MDIYFILMTLDINECANRSTIDCTQQCINTPGSYECDCYDGYRAITANATQCEGTYILNINSLLEFAYGLRCMLVSFQISMSVRNTMIVIRCVLTLKDHTTAVVTQDLCWKQTIEFVEVSVWQCC